MRYRIVLEIETGSGRAFVDRLAQRCFDETVTKESNPVFLSTEEVGQSKVVLRKQVPMRIGED